MLVTRAVAAASLLVIAGCASSKTPAASTAPALVASAQPTTSAAPTDVPVPAGTAPDATVSYAFTAKTADGTTEKGTLKLWPPRSATGFLPWDGWPASSCRPDVGRDAYLPVSLSVENTTASFAATTRIGLEVQPEAPYPVSDDQAGSCRSTAGTSSDGLGNEGEAFRAGRDQAPSGSGPVTELGYLLLPGFYSPALPNGAFKALGSREPLRLDASIAGGASYAITSVKGMGAHHNDSLGFWAVTFDGTPAG